MDLPSVIGERYEVVRLLGQGGMGRVVLAKDKVLGRKVAVKVLRDDLGLPPDVKNDLLDRMRNEARAAAALGHPNIVTLHDMGEDAALGLFLVFEFIEGLTLRERIERGAIPVLDVVKLARELGSALTHAHDAGVIHRDVKPENVMLSPTGAKLTDLGIARVPDSTLTRAGVILGTPAYSAPEVLASGDFSPQSDQFSFAATLFEALTGQRAFPGDDAVAVAAKISNDPPPRASAAGLRVPLRIDAALERAMNRDPNKRFVSCAELGRVFEVAVDPSSSMPSFSLMPPPVPSRTSSFIPRATRRWQNLTAAAAVIVIATLIVLGRRSEDPGTGVSLRAVASAFAAALSQQHVIQKPRPKATGGNSGSSASADPSSPPRDAGVSDYRSTPD